MQIATMIEKAPLGGYTLKQITLREGQEPLVETIMCKSTLPEISMHELAMKGELFKENAWFKAPSEDPSIVNKVAGQVIAMLRQAQQQEQPPALPPDDPLELPKMYQGNGHDQNEVDRLTGSLMNRMGRQAATFVAFAFCTATWLSFNLRGLVT